MVMDGPPAAAWYSVNRNEKKKNKPLNKVGQILLRIFHLGQLY